MPHTPVHAYSESAEAHNHDHSLFYDESSLDFLTLASKDSLDHLLLPRQFDPRAFTHASAGDTQIHPSTPLFLTVMLRGLFVDSDHDTHHTSNLGWLALRGAHNYANVQLRQMATHLESPKLGSSTSMYALHMDLRCRALISRYLL